MSTVVEHATKEEQLRIDREKWRSDLIAPNMAKHRIAVREWELRRAEILNKQKPIRAELDRELDEVMSSRPPMPNKSHSYARMKLFDTSPESLIELRDKAIEHLERITCDSARTPKILFLTGRKERALERGDSEEAEKHQRDIDAMEEAAEPIRAKIAEIEQRMIEA